MCPVWAATGRRRYPEVTAMGGAEHDQAAVALTGERADLVALLDRHRGLLLRTVRDLTDEQAAQRTTASELCLGGIIKHVASVEKGWAGFIVEGPAQDSGHDAAGGWDEASVQEYLNGFRMLPGETLAGLVEEYAKVARRTDGLVASLPDLDASQPLPSAPWFEPGTRWSARRVLVHIIAETAQHAGHADIIRESLDGAKTMG
jgi:uncharacterized damage-inducible protein DinB